MDVFFRPISSYGRCDRILRCHQRQRQSEFFSRGTHIQANSRTAVTIHAMNTQCCQGQCELIDTCNNDYYPLPRHSHFFSFSSVLKTQTKSNNRDINSMFPIILLSLVNSILFSQTRANIFM